MRGIIFNSFISEGFLEEDYTWLIWQIGHCGWNQCFTVKTVWDVSGNLARAHSCNCSVQLLSRVRLCNPMNCSMPGLPVHHQLPEFTQTHVHRVGDAIQPSHPLLSSSPPAPNPSQHQSLFQWVSSLHEVAKVLEFQSLFQWVSSLHEVAKVLEFQL